MAETDAITAAIESSISGLEGRDGADVSTDSGSNSEAVGGGSDTAGVGTGASTDVSESGAAGADATAATTDDIDRILEDAGFKPAPAGQRENRIPHSRTKKIIANALKKQTDAHTAALTERDTKLTAAQARLKEADNWDSLVASDPDKLMGMLSALHPNLYGKFISGKVTAAEVKQVVTGVATKARPEPDAKFEDGSVGYSAEGLQKLLDWNAEQAENRAFERANAEATKRFGPLEERYKAQQAYDAQVPKIRAQVATATKTWGKLFEDDYAKDKDSEILAVMRANDGMEGRPFMSFDNCVAQVLIPKLQTTRESMRGDILKEINARPAAAAKTTPAAVKTAEVSADDETIEDVIRASIAGMR